MLLLLLLLPSLQAEVEVPVVVAIITLQLRNSVGALDVGGSETVQNHPSLVDQKTNL